MSGGLKDQDLEDIVQVMRTFVEVDKAILFGSRAKGNYKHGSDVDIAVYGNRINMNTISSIHAILEEESNMPYFFDIIDGTHLKQKELLDHIARVGKVIYERKSR